MKPTDKHKCIAEQWIYGLKVHGMGCFDPDTEEAYVMKIVDMDITSNELRAIVVIHDDTCDDVCDEHSSYLSVEEEISPILRPLSDLNKEITHKGYNDDKPFIPLVELAKVLGIKKCSLDIENKFLVNWDAEDDNPYDAEHLGFYDGWPYLFKNRGNNYSPAYPCDFTPQIYDLLHLWHFDTRNLIEDGEAIDVNTLDINPYSVK